MEFMPDFNVLRPTSIDEAVRFFNSNPDARYLAGGTDILVNVRRGIVDAPVMIDLANIEEMHGISELPDGGLRIGAGMTLNELAESAVIQNKYPAITKAALEVAATSHREVATLGGNLCLDTRCVFYNQSEWWRNANDYCLKYNGDTCHVAPSGKTCFAAFSGDVAPAALIYDGSVELNGPGGKRSIALCDMYQDDGMAHLLLAKGEVLTAVTLPPPSAGTSGYSKVRVRDAIDFPLAGIAVFLARDGELFIDIKIALTGTNSQPFVLDGTEQFIGKSFDDDTLDQLIDLIPKQIQPMTSTFSPPGYRRKVVNNLARDLITRLWENI
jgi:4-hydroxybenzoyl-CoA reductase subunit beta